MRRPQTLRSRLLLVTATTLLAGLGLLVTVGNVLFASTVAHDNSARLSARLEAQVTALSLQDGRVRVRDTLNDASLDTYGWIFLRGRLVEQPSTHNERLDRIAATLARANAGAHPVRSGSFLMGSHVVAPTDTDQPGAVVIAAVDIAQLESLRSEVLYGSVALALLVLVGGTLVTRRVLTAALAPVSQMTAAAGDWEAHDLDRRFELGPPRDEITGLAATLDHLLGRIAASRRHEQRFASEVAHELRTPLAAIRGVAELARGGDAATTDQALEEVVAHSQRIATSLDTLIAFARRQTVPDPAGVDLAAVASSFPDVEVLASDHVVPLAEGDPDLVRQIFAPIVDNARRHAVSGVSIALSVRGGRVLAVIRDDGPGVDPTLGVKVLLPGVRGSHETGEGAGLGLPLAQRLANSCGGEIQLGDGPGGCFVVALPAISGDQRAAAAPTVVG